MCCKSTKLDIQSLKDRLAPDHAGTFHRRADLSACPEVASEAAFAALVAASDNGEACVGHCGFLRGCRPQEF